VSTTGSDYTQQSAWFCNTTSNTDLTKCAITWRDANSFTTHWGTNSAGTGNQRAYECKYFIGKDISNNFNIIEGNLHIGDVVQYTFNTNTNRSHTLIVYDITTTDVILACHTSDSKTISLKTKADNNTNQMFVFARIKST